MGVARVCQRWVSPHGLMRVASSRGNPQSFVTGQALTMNEPHPPPGFDLPPRLAATPEAPTGATPAHLAAWLDRVSTDDPLGALKRLLDTTRILNRTPLEPAETLKLTNLLETRASPILERIDTHLRTLDPPLEGDDKASAASFGDLLRELAQNHLDTHSDGPLHPALPSSAAGTPPPRPPRKK